MANKRYFIRTLEDLKVPIISIYDMEYLDLVEYIYQIKTAIVYVQREYYNYNYYESIKRKTDINKLLLQDPEYVEVSQLLRELERLRKTIKYDKRYDEYKTYELPVNTLKWLNVHNENVDLIYQEFD